VIYPRPHQADHLTVEAYGTEAKWSNRRRTVQQVSPHRSLPGSAWI